MLFPQSELLRHFRYAFVPYTELLVLFAQRTIAVDRERHCIAEVWLALGFQPGFFFSSSESVLKTLHHYGLGLSNIYVFIKPYVR